MIRMQHNLASYLQPRSLLIGAAIGIGIGLFVARMQYPAIETPVRAEVHGVRLDATGHEPLVPRQGYHFVIVDTSIVNDSDTTIDVAPLLNLYIKDSEGFMYAETGVPTRTEMRSGALLAHDSLREEIGFMVKDGATGLKLYYEPGVQGSRTQVIDFGPYLR